MWIFTKHGFFSAVCARQGSGKHHEPVDVDRIMVRVRVREHLEALMQRFPELLGDVEIRQFGSTDYAYRIFIDKSVWAQVLSSLAEETDYDNFKSTVERHRGDEDPDYEHALHEVWSVMHGLQRRNDRGEGSVADYLVWADKDGNITHKGKAIPTDEELEATIKESDLSFLQQEATELTEDEMTFEEWKEAMQNPDNVRIIDTGIRCTGEKYRPPSE